MLREYEPDDISALKENLNQLHSDKRSNQEWDADLYEQNNVRVRRYIPQDIPVYQSALATEIVDETSDSLRTDTPLVSHNLRTRGRKDENERHRARMQEWGEKRLLFDQAYADIDPYNQAGLDLALRGESILKILHNADFPEKPTRDEFKGKGKFDNAIKEWRNETSAINPLLPTRAVDPLGVYLPPDASYPLAYVVEHQTRRQIDMWEQYPAWKEEARDKVYSLGGSERAMNPDELNDPTREVEWLECWTCSHYIVWVGGVEVIRKKNPYGFVPYVHSYAGLGRSDARGDSSDKAASMLSKIRGEVEAEIIGKTIKFELAKLYVFPRVMVPDGQADRVAESLRARGIIEYDPEMGPDSIKWLDSPPINPAVSDFMDGVNTAIAKRANPIMRGMPEQDAQYGVLEALRLGQATKGIQNIAVNLNRMRTSALNVAARIVDKMGFEYDNMKSNDFNEPDFKVEFKAVDPVEETRRHMAGLALFRTDRAITKRTLRREFLDGVIKDIEEEEVQEMAERSEEAFYSSPQFTEFAIEMHRAEMLTQMAEEARGNAEQARTALPGGAPGIPGMGMPQAMASPLMGGNASGAIQGPGAGQSPTLPASPPPGQLLTTPEQVGGPGVSAPGLGEAQRPLAEARQVMEAP